MKSVLIGVYILFTEVVYILALFLISYFFVKFFWNKEKIVSPNGKVKIVENEKPNRKHVSVVFVSLFIIILFIDILCACMDIDVVAAYRVYPFDMEETNIEGIYPRFLYNMQIVGENDMQDVKFNILCWYNVKELEKTQVRNDLKKNKTTYFEDKKNEIINENVINKNYENIVEENVVENNIVENKITNSVKENVVANNIKNTTNTNVVNVANESINIVKK